MIARLKKTVGKRPAGSRAKLTLLGLALLAVVSACTSYTEIPIETPIQPKLDVSAFQRVLIAGFVTGGSDDVDANQETVRLLRSQLRSKSSLRVIDADVMPLVEIAQEQSKGSSEAEETGGRAVRSRLSRISIVARSSRCRSASGTKKIWNLTSACSPTRPTGSGSARNFRTPSS